MYLIWRLYQPVTTPAPTSPGCVPTSWQQTSSSLVAVRARRCIATALARLSCLVEAVSVATDWTGHMLCSQVGLVVWVILIAYYLARATRSLRKRPYTAFRCDASCGAPTSCAEQLSTMRHKYAQNLLPCRPPFTLNPKPVKVSVPTPTHRWSWWYEGKRRPSARRRCRLCISADAKLCCVRRKLSTYHDKPVCERSVVRYRCVHAGWRT